MKITLAKALKLKNRITSKIADVSTKIYSYNSITVGEERPVDVSELMIRRDKLVEALVQLKTNINVANQPIQQTIYLLSELKGEMGFLGSINTDNGKKVHSYTFNEERVIEKSAIIDYNSVQGLLEQAQEDIDKNQDSIDVHNHTTEISVPDEVFTLLKG